MTLRTTTLLPGLLVSLKTSVTGDNLTYKKRILEAKHIVRGVQRAKWETVREITDPAEMEAAWAVQAKTRSLIAGVCSNSAFGLLCPESSLSELEAAIAEARRQAQAFNETAELTTVRVYVITGRIAPSDVEAMGAINSEVRELMEEMQRGVQNLDAKAIRAAAGRLKSVGGMLTPEAMARVQEAIDSVRSFARKVVKAGEGAAVEIDQEILRKLTDARTSFLDLEPGDEIAVPRETARAVSLTPLEEAIQATPPPVVDPSDPVGLRHTLALARDEGRRRAAGARTGRTRNRGWPNVEERERGT